VGDAAVEAVTTRSVLIYVKEKQRAFDEFYRVLKTGGRLSICEPINRFLCPEPPHLFDGYDVTPVMDLAAKIGALLEAIQPDDDPMLDFDEQELMLFAESAGFGEVHLELQAEMRPKTAGMSWEAYLAHAPNPKLPTLQEAMNQVFSPEESARFAEHLRPLVENRRGTSKSAMAFLWAAR
jgi:SAM-dependent methyltransferase